MKRLHYLVCTALLFGTMGEGFGQGTAFLYQGQLTANGVPANGAYDLVFSLFNSNNPVSGTLTNPATAVSNGLFSVALDFGSSVFNGSNLWLQIGVRTNGAAAFTPLWPMQPVLAAPYAVMAATASNLAGPLTGDGSGLANVDAALLDGLAASNFATLNLLTNYAPLAALTNSAVSSPIPNMQVFDTPGGGQFTVPAGVTRIAVEVWGAGGGGGNAGSSSPGAGGGAGGYGKGVFTVTPGDSYAVVVGAGGTSGVNGGNSFLGFLISASGGSAGGSSPNSGAGGSSTAPINIPGGAGQWSSAIGGSRGGNAGNGGSGGTGDALSGGIFAGGAGQVPGGGGGGGYDDDDQGGTGGHGRVIIYY